jgi:hypothetical protein
MTSKPRVEGVLTAITRVMIAIPGIEGSGDCYNWNRVSNYCYTWNRGECGERYT